MRVTEHIEKSDRFISFEIIPPKRENTLKSLIPTIEAIAIYKPPFIDVTSHAAVLEHQKTQEGIVEVVERKRPGTLSICTLIQHMFGIDAVPHVLCHGFDQEETEDFLLEIRHANIENILTIRGDDNGYNKAAQEGRNRNENALDLVQQISGYTTDLCIGVSAYPEKHFESPNLKTDIQILKKKVEAGANYAVTQMFFNNTKYFNYVQQCRAEGIGTPIIPGLKIITSKKQLRSLPKNFHVEIPYDLSNEVENTEDKYVIEVGVEWAKMQIQELFSKGIPGVHLYILQNPKPVNMLMKKLQMN